MVKLSLYVGVLAFDPGVLSMRFDMFERVAKLCSQNYCYNAVYNYQHDTGHCFCKDIFSSGEPYDSQYWPANISAKCAAASATSACQCTPSSCYTPASTATATATVARTMTQEQLSTIMDTSTQSNMITDITTATSTEYDTATVTVTTTLEAITITAPPTLASIIADCIIMVTVPYPTP